MQKDKTCILCRPVGKVQILSALVIFGLLTIAIIIAWGFEYAGYIPCKLCLEQRWPYYIGIPMAAFIAVMGKRGTQPALVRGMLLLLGLLMLWGAALGVNHAGIEWGLWRGPAGCTGTGAAPSDAGSLLQQLQTVRIVACDAVAGRFLGLSFAGWNVVVTGTLTLLSLFAALTFRRHML